MMMVMLDWHFINSYGIIAVALVAVAVLLVVRQRLRANLRTEADSGEGEQEAVESRKVRDYLIPEIVERVSVGNAQTIGRRQEQDDYFTSSTTRIGTMAAIADGISGLSHGRMASTLAVTMFAKEYLRVDDPEDIPAFFEKAAAISNRAILEQLGGAQGGTTLVVGVVASEQLYWAAVGDSMIILFRDGQFIPMNSKHTLESVLEEKYLSGEISKEEVKANPMRNQLINYLGYAGFKSMEIGQPVALRSKDTIILCSDGVYDALTEVEMEQILLRGLPPQEAAEEMISLIEQKGFKHQDNATVIIMEVD